MSEIALSCTVNDRQFEGNIAANLLLLDFLRDRLGLTGVKQSCEVQVCGTCTVLVDGQPVSSCCHLAADVDGRQVLTIEGVVGSQYHERVSAAFMKYSALQCGFCTAGMILTVKALADQEGELSRDEVRQALSGNLCRCTGYQSILDAACETLGVADGIHP
ncbi:MAG: 2Fe-2S iron-sulfur cluster-binding protein [Candidatus Dormiibacterota bacterium]